MAGPLTHLTPYFSTHEYGNNERPFVARKVLRNATSNPASVAVRPHPSILGPLNNERDSGEESAGGSRDGVVIELQQEVEHLLGVIQRIVPPPSYRDGE